MIPDAGPVKDTFAGEITRLAQLDPVSPIFEPHVTLYHPIPLDRPTDSIIDTVKECIAGMPGEVRLSVKSAQTGTSYYQSILAAIQRHDELEALRRRCEQAFGPLEKPYFAHLSLKYCDGDQEVRSKIAAQSNLACEIAIRGVALMRLDGIVNEWQEVAFCPFV